MLDTWVVTIVRQLGRVVDCVGRIVAGVGANQRNRPTACGDRDVQSLMLRMNGRDLAQATGQRCSFDDDLVYWALDHVQRLDPDSIENPDPLCHGHYVEGVVQSAIAAV